MEAKLTAGLVVRFIDKEKKEGQWPEQARHGYVGGQWVAQPAQNYVYLNGAWWGKKNHPENETSPGPETLLSSSWP